MKKAMALILLALLIFSFAACGGSEEGEVTKITVASDCTWPPMEFINKDKEIVGFDIDLIKAIGEATGVEIDVKNTAWDGIFAGLGNGNYDAVISSVTITEDRQKTMDFSSPYINAGQVIIVQKSTSGVTTLDDLDGKKVGAQIGTTGAIEVGKYDTLTLKTYDELGLAVADLANGRIDAVVADTPIAASYALQNDEYKGKLQIVGEPFTDEYYGIAVKKGNDRILSVLEEGLQKVKEEGLLDELRSQWLK